MTSSFDNAQAGMAQSSSKFLIQLWIKLNLQNLTNYRVQLYSLGLSLLQPFQAFPIKLASAP